ncbi:hypothetical protein M0804_004201 [Polistes exclamans]|nr:hypothetical protein M0804_004201 [Polistes exclamans]
MWVSKMDGVTLLEKQKIVCLLTPEMWVNKRRTSLIVLDSAVSLNDREEKIDRLPWLDAATFVPHHPKPPAPCPQPYSLLLSRTSALFQENWICLKNANVEPDCGGQDTLGGVRGMLRLVDIVLSYDKNKKEEEEE